MKQKRSDIKVVVLDLDGTLLNSEKQVSKRNIDVIHRAHGMGIRTTLASGRMPAMLELYGRMLPIDIPIIAGGGSVLYDLRRKHVLMGATIATRDVLPVLSYVSNFDYTVICEDGVYFCPESQLVGRVLRYNEMARLEDLSQIPVFYVQDPNQLLTKKIYKVLVWETRLSKLDEVRKTVDTLPGTATVYSEEGLLDIIHSGVSKGAGVEALAAHLGISISEICVMGDYENDISMFEVAGMSIAMGNAHADVKHVATHITATNDEDGVACAYERFIFDESYLVGG